MSTSTDKGIFERAGGVPESFVSHEQAILDKKIGRSMREALMGPQARGERVPAELNPFT